MIQISYYSLSNPSYHDKFSVSSPHTLDQIGWNQHWQDLFLRYEGPYIPGRVSTVHKTRYEVLIPDGTMTLPISGALIAKKEFPVVGDFVVILHQPEQATSMIVAVLPRMTTLSQGEAGESGGEQHLAANIDTAFIVTDPANDFNIARFERYLLIVRSARAQPVIILNKTDIQGDSESRVRQIGEELGDIPVIAVSAMQKTGLGELTPYLGNGKTIVFLGSSGVGKSTLMNALSGSDLRKTGATREDDGRGRHTTTTRHLSILADGTALIDTPGLREIRIWTAEEHVAESFGDIQEFAVQCRFSDCSHTTEPGCAVRKAIADGILRPERLERYQKLLRELAFEHQKAIIGLKQFEKKRFKEISILGKEIEESRKRSRT